MFVGFVGLLCLLGLLTSIELLGVFGSVVFVGSVDLLLGLLCYKLEPKYGFSCIVLAKKAIRMEKPSSMHFFLHHCMFQNICACVFLNCIYGRIHGTLKHDSCSFTELAFSNNFY